MATNGILVFLFVHFIISNLLLFASGFSFDLKKDPNAI